MKFTRPIVFFDIESTGLDTQKDRIVELCITKLTPTMETTTHSYGGQNFHQTTSTKRFNPQIPIGEKATETHGITNEDVKDLEPFRATAEKTAKYITGCDIAGFNSNRFDIPMLVAEFNRANVEWDWKSSNFIDAGNLYKIENPRTLSAAYKQYTGKELEGAHEAEADVQATIDVFFGMLSNGFSEHEGELTVESIALYSNYGNEIIDLAGKFIKNEQGQIIFNFGKHKGKLASSERGFISWMLDKDFTADTKRVCYELLRR